MVGRVLIAETSTTIAAIKAKIEIIKATLDILGSGPIPFLDRKTKIIARGQSIIGKYTEVMEKIEITLKTIAAVAKLFRAE